MTKWRPRKGDMVSVTLKVEDAYKYFSILKTEDDKMMAAFTNSYLQPIAQPRDCDDCDEAAATIRQLQADNEAISKEMFRLAKAVADSVEALAAETKRADRAEEGLAEAWDKAIEAAANKVHLLYSEHPRKEIVVEKIRSLKKDTTNG